MKKSELVQLIREEIANLNDSDTIVNPKTGRKIKITTALSYPADHPAYKLALMMQRRHKTVNTKK